MCITVINRHGLQIKSIQFSNVSIKYLNTLETLKDVIFKLQKQTIMITHRNIL